MADYESFAKLASGIQSIFTVLGMIVGGIWVLFTFWNLGATQRSRAEIAEIEQRSLEQPVLSIDIIWGTFSEYADRKRAVSLRGIFKNDGKRAVVFEDVAVDIFRLSESGSPISTELIHLKAQTFDDGQGKLTDMPFRILRTGQGRSVAFLVPPLVPGCYFVQLRTVYTGAVIRDGELYRSNDKQINAIEQKIVSVPADAGIQDKQSISGKGH